MEVAEEGGLPAAERVVRHRHRDRHVDAHHAHVDVELELARDATVPGEDRGTVAVGFSFTSLSASSYVDVHDGEHRAEDLVPVRVHLGPHVVEERRAEEEALSRRGLASVRHDRGALLGAGVEIARDLVTVLL